MTYSVFYRLAIIISVVLIWAPLIQTLGHVWLYTSLAAISLFGLKLLLPHLTVLVVTLFIWWKLSSSLFTASVVSSLLEAAIIFFGRNVTKLNFHAQPPLFY